MTTAKKIKLAKLLSLVKELPSDKGLIVVDGEIEIGNDVFIYDTENSGEPTPAPDGIYKTDEVEITVESGKIKEVKKIEKEETPVVEENKTEETTEEIIEAAEDENVDMLKARITELEADVANRDAIIEELQKELEDYRKKEETPVADPADDSNEIKMSNVERRTANALGIVSFLNKSK